MVAVEQVEAEEAVEVEGVEAVFGGDCCLLQLMQMKISLQNGILMAYLRIS